MGILEIILIGIGLAMDAVAVSMTNGMVYRKLKSYHYIYMILAFSVFQGIMPLLGYFAGSLFASILERYAGIAILIILGIIGGKMVYEGFTHKDEETPKENFTISVLLLQSIATSIDAFAVGVGFSAMKVNIMSATTIIAVTTGIMVAIAIVIGRKVGDMLGSKAEILGGCILIIIGIKSFLS